MIQRDSHIPLYSQIRQVIEQELVEKKLGPGQALPSEGDLAVRFGVNRMTVRRAVDLLVAQGLLCRIQGRGTFVAQQKAQTKPEGITRWTFERVEQSHDFHQQVLTVEQVPSSLTTANALHTMPGEPVIQLSRIWYSGDASFAYRVDRISKLLVHGINDWSLGDEPLYEFLARRCGLEFGRVVERVGPILAEEEVAEYLSVQPGTPILHVNTLLYVASSIPAILADTFYRTDRYVYRLILHPLSEAQRR